MDQQYTRLDLKQWPRNTRFQDFATFLGLRVEKDGKGIFWPYSNLTIQKLEELYKWGKVKSNSLNHEDIK